MAKTWIVVAESTRAKLYQDDKGGGLQELHDFAHPEGRLHEQKLTSDLPGRTFDRGGQGRHAMEEDTPPKRYEAEEFARELTDYLEQGRTQSRFAQLALIAEPRFLGMLRDQLGDELRKMVVFELDKNLTQHSAADIRGHLPDRL